MASCLQKHDVSRETDQSIIEAARCMFHKLLEEARDDLGRVAPWSQEGFCTEIKQSKQRRSHTVKENPCSRPEKPSEKSVLQTSTETPLPQPSAESLEQVIEDDPRKQLELSVPRYEAGEWQHEFLMSSFTTTILNLLFTEAEKKGKTRNSRMYLGPGSVASSADQLYIDLEGQPLGHSDHLPARLAFDEQDSLHAIRPVRNLVHMSVQTDTPTAHHMFSCTVVAQTCFTCCQSVQSQIDLHAPAWLKIEAHICISPQHTSSSARHLIHLAELDTTHEQTPSSPFSRANLPTF